MTTAIEILESRLSQIDNDEAAGLSALQQQADAITERLNEVNSVISDLTEERASVVAAINKLQAS